GGESPSSTQISPQLRKDIAARTATVIQSLSSSQYSHPTLTAKTLRPFAERLVKYLWDVDQRIVGKDVPGAEGGAGAGSGSGNEAGGGAGGAGAGANDAENFFVQWNVEYIWQKWESQEDSSLPARVAEVISGPRARERAGSNDLVLDFVVSMANAVVVYISGRSPEDVPMDNTSDSSFNANEQMPSLLKVGDSDDHSKVQDMDLVPAILVILLLHGLEHINETTDPSYRRMILGSLSSCVSILSGPRRTSHTFVALLSAFAVRANTTIQQLARIMVESGCYDTTLECLSIFSSFLATMVECRMQIPFIPSLSISTENFLETMEAELPRFTAIMTERCTSPTSFFDIALPAMNVVMSMTTLCQRFLGKPPHEPNLVQFIQALARTLKTCFKSRPKETIGTVSTTVGSRVLYIVGEFRRSQTSARLQMALQELEAEVWEDGLWPRHVPRPDVNKSGGGGLAGAVMDAGDNETRWASLSRSYSTGGPLPPAELHVCEPPTPPLKQTPPAT
ncbi:hypothetical protein HK102_010365, partial [Quaeritorhiza haematococci]